MKALHAAWVSIPSLMAGLAVTLEVALLVVVGALVLGLLLGGALAFGPRGVAGRRGLWSTWCAGCRSWC